VRVCHSLQEASDQPYFYEGCGGSAKPGSHLGPDYEEWAAEKRTQLSKGRDLFYLGDPDREAQGRE
jgi:hypothetical protein